MDSEPLHWSCWREVLSPLGIDLDWETYSRTCIGVTDIRVLQDLGLPMDVLAAKTERFRATKLPIIESIIDFIKTLSMYRLGIVSSSDRCDIEPVLVRAGIRDCFEVLVCGGDVRNHKPAPDPYLLAGRILGIQRALVVEDSYVGEQSARAAGFDVVRVRNVGELVSVAGARLR